MDIDIKICGLKTVEDIQIVSLSGAKWAGFVFYDKSPRNIKIKEVKKLLKNVPPNLTPVAVMVNPKFEDVVILKSLGIDTFQLHGNESPKFCNTLITEINVEVIKGINVWDSKDIFLSKKYINTCNWLLFDSKSVDNELPGGNGNPFDWKILQKINFDCKWILSGGLNISNVKEAINVSGAMAIDVSSGVEIKPGVKGKELIKDFCKVANL